MQSAERRIHAALDKNCVRLFFARFSLPLLPNGFDGRIPYVTHGTCIMHRCAINVCGRAIASHKRHNSNGAQEIELNVKKEETTLDDDDMNKISFAQCIA